MVSSRDRSVLCLSVLGRHDTRRDDEVPWKLSGAHATPPRESDRERFAAALRKAGLPEE